MLLIPWLLALACAPTSPQDDGLAALAERLATLGDDAEADLVEGIAELGTPEACAVLLDAYGKLSSPYLRRAVLRAMPRFAAEEALAAVAVERLATSARSEREVELRLAAVEALASCPRVGRAALRRLVDSPAPSDARVRALELHVAAADEADLAWYRELLAPPSEVARGSRTARSRGEPERPAGPPLERLREIALAALAQRLAPDELRELIASEPSAELRMAELAALGERAPEAAERVAEELLADTVQPPAVRAAAARHLARLRGPRMVDGFLALARKQESTPELLRETLAELLSTMGDDKVAARLERLVGRGQPRERRFALLATRRIVDEGLDRKRLAALGDDDPLVWSAALDVVADRRPEGAREELESQLARADDPARRVALIAALDRLHDVDPAWTARLLGWIGQGEREVRNRALGLYAARAGSEALPALASALSHEDWSTRLTALEGLERLRTRAAVGAIVARVQEESGQVLARFAESLWRLTGKPFRARASAWREWWAAEGESFEPIAPSELARLEEERRERDLRQVTRTSFFGLRIVSRRVVFVVDVSGSMLEPLRGPFAEAAGEVRLEVAQRELARAIGALEPGTLFNVIPFSDGVAPWLKSADASREEGREGVLAFVSRLGARGGTNLYGALRVAFADPDADTVVVLSDGEPSTGEVIDPGAIREHVRRWNADRHIVIDCVAIGGSLRVLEWLARDSGGTYVHIE